MGKAHIYYHPSLYRDKAPSKYAPNSERAFNKIYRNYQRKAFEKERNFTITKAQFKDLILKDCFYCGEPPSNTAKEGNQTFIYNGLDRLDNETPYTLDNVVPSCKVCNFMKGQLGLHDFLNQVVRINHHLVRDNLPKQYPKS